MVAITDQEFAQFQRFIFESAGITLSPAKKALVSGRLARRLDLNNATSYGDYFRLLSSGKSPQEVQMAIDLLTTNETYFFREPKHCDFLRRQAAQFPISQPLRIWSAAGSTGEEAYSIAMMLEDIRAGHPWEVMASDISVRVLQRARAGHYPMERARHVSQDYLRRFCLRGEGEQEGTMLVEKSLRNKVKFLQVNLNEPLPNIGTFEMVFLRNVLIYFNGETKRKVVERALSVLQPGGYLLIGHSESLHGVNDTVQTVAPSIYRKP
jgi:chemotaxis protein methyltransferase CheR